jgi:radical SAM superfamily enzyme YgiQ (UPF0313 family)
MSQLKDHLEAAKGQAFMPQLTLPYLAALGYQYNEQNRMTHQFVFIDDCEENIDLGGFDMAWFTTVTSTAQAVYRLSDRARLFGITTVIGGIHATMCREEAAAHADALALGEGETTVPELLTDWIPRGTGCGRSISVRRQEVSIICRVRAGVTPEWGTTALG